MNLSMNRHNVLPLALVVAGTLVLSGCSYFSGLKLDDVTDSVDYTTGGNTVANLAVPPGLSAPAFDDTYAVDPNGIATASALQQQAGIQVPRSAASPVVVSRLSAGLTQLQDGNPALAVSGGYDQVWAQTGVLLGRVRLKVTAQQREQGIYTVTRVSESESQPDRGFFQKMMAGEYFESHKEAQREKDKQQGVGETYRIVIADQGSQSLIVVGDENGAPANAERAAEILGQLKAEFER